MKKPSSIHLLIYLIGFCMAGNLWSQTVFKGPGAKVRPPFNLEDVADKTQFKEPRFQFIWHHPQTKRRNMWTLKLDGTDLRRVTDEAFLYQGGGITFNDPVRSPNNRYIALRIGSPTAGRGGAEGRIYDLKEKTMVRFCPNLPHGYAFTPDSKRLIFWEVNKFQEFDIATKKTKKITTMWARKIAISNDNRLFTLHKRKVELYTLKGKKIKVINFPKEVYGYDFHVSPSGKSFVVENFGYFLFKTAGSSKPVFSHNPKNRIYNVSLLRDEAIYYDNYDGMHKYDIKTGKHSLKFVHPGVYFQIINQNMKK